MKCSICSKRRVKLVKIKILGMEKCVCKECSKEFRIVGKCDTVKEDKKID